MTRISTIRWKSLVPTGPGEKFFVRYDDDIGAYSLTCGRQWTTDCIRLRLTVCTQFSRFSDGVWCWTSAPSPLLSSNGKLENRDWKIVHSQTDTKIAHTNTLAAIIAHSDGHSQRNTVRPEDVYFPYFHNSKKARNFMQCQFCKLKNQKHNAKCRSCASITRSLNSESQCINKY